MKNLPKLKNDTKLISGEWLIVDVESGLWNVVAFPNGKELIEGMNKRMPETSDKLWDIKTTKIVDTKTAVDIGLLTLEGNNYRLSEISMENAKKLSKANKRSIKNKK